MKLLTFSLLLLISSAKSQNIDDIKLPLIDFLRKLSSNNPSVERNLNWTTNSDPCLDQWRGISCNNRSRSLRSIDLESLNLSGSIDGKILSKLCNESSLSVLNLNSNSLTGHLPPEISYCLQMTNLFLSDNRLSGNLPSSLPNLGNLKKLDISNNNFSGDLPWNLSDISGLDTFLADRNRFTGTIPAFDLNFFNKFNVSFNQLSGPVPLNSAKFPLSSFDGNSQLCGKPLEVSCPPPSSSTSESKKTSVNKVVLIIGYALLGLALVLLLFYYLMNKKEAEITHKRESSDRKLLDSSDQKAESTSGSEYSISSPQSAAAGSSASLTLLSKDGRTKDLKFEDLLRAPAELVRKGSFGSLYKVVVAGGETELVVKRIKDSTVTGEEFRKRILRIDQASHPNVLPVTALYCSKQEKLVVYEYQKNGSLFKLLHGSHHRPCLFPPPSPLGILFQPEHVEEKRSVVGHIWQRVIGKHVDSLDCNLGRIAQAVNGHNAVAVIGVRGTNFGIPALSRLEETLQERYCSVVGSVVNHSPEEDGAEDVIRSSSGKTSRAFSTVSYAMSRKKLSLVAKRISSLRTPSLDWNGSPDLSSGKGDIASHQNAEIEQMAAMAPGEREGRKAIIRSVTGEENLNGGFYR